MKKIFCFALIFLFTLCGCETKTTKVQLVTTGISFTAEIKQNNNSCLFDVVIDKDSVMNITSCDDKNFKITFCGNNMTAFYENVEYTCPVSSIPSNLNFDFLYALFSDLTVGKSVVEKDDNYYIMSSNAKYDATLYITKSGIPLKVTENRFGTEIVFKKVYIL